jgi:hypothetical protein
VEISTKQEDENVKFSFRADYVPALDYGLQILVVLRRNDAFHLDKQFIGQFCRNEALRLVLRAGWPSATALLPAEVARAGHCPCLLRALCGAKARPAVRVTGLCVNHVSYSLRLAGLLTILCYISGKE